MSREDRWQGRPWVAFVIRALVFLVPIGLSVASAYALQQVIPKPDGWLKVVGWWVGIAAVSTVVLWIADRAARRALPLAALFKLSLVFPDQAPSRYKIARKAGNLRDLESELEQAREEGLAGDRTAAAETILRLVAHLSEHDRATRGHSERVRVFTDMLADELDLDEEQRDRLRWAALLHDVGKLTVHSDILNKPGKPTEEEWVALKHHPVAGAEITAPLHAWLGEWALAVEQHHEKYDGSGYPGGLSGTAISWGARIVAVGDAYDTMTAARAYKKPMSAVDARRELATCAGSHFDPVVVRAFLSISLGRLRLAMGPLSWAAQGPLGAISGRAVEGIATGVAAMGAVAAVVAPSMIEKPSTPPEPTVVAAPSETPAPTLPPIAVPSPEAPTAEPSDLAPTDPPTSEPSEPAVAPTATVAPVEQPQPQPQPSQPPVTPEPAPTTPDPAPPAPTVGPPAPTPAPPAPTPTPVPVVVPIATIAAAPGDGSNVSPGDTVSVTVRVTMPSDATGPTSSTLTIPLPAGATLVPGSLTVDGSRVSGPDPTAGAITLPDLAPGESVVVSYVLEVAEDAREGTIVIPTAQVRTAAATVSTGLGTGLTVRLPLTPTITIAASPREVLPGGTVDVTTTVRNPGPGIADAGDLVVSASLSAGLTSVPGTTRIGSTSSAASPTGGIALPRLGVGESVVVTFRARVSATATSGTGLSVTSRVSGARVASPPSATATVTVPATTAVTVTGSPTPPDGTAVRRDDTITVSYIVTNGAAATATASGLSLRVPTPSGASYVLGSARADGVLVPGGASANPWEAARSVPALAPASSYTVTYDVKVAATAADGDVLVSAAQLTGGATTVSASSSWTVDAEVALTLDLSSDPTAGDLVPGTRVDFTARVGNAASASADASAVDFTASVPAGLVYVAGSAAVDGVAVEPASTALPFADGHALGAVAPSDSFIITWSARLPTPSDDGLGLDTVATVTAAAPTPASTRTITHVVRSATAPSVLLTAPAGVVATPGKTVPMRVEVENAASATAVARGMVLTDLLPAQATYEPGSARDASGALIEPSPGQDPFAGTGFAVPDLAPGDAAVYTFDVRIARPVPDRTVLPIEVRLADGAATLSSDLELVVSSSPSVTLDFTVDAADPVAPGQNLTYRLTASNAATATATATGTTVRVAVPAELRYVEDSATRRDGSTITSATNPYATAVPIGDLLPGEDASITVTFTVARPIADATVVSVVGTVTTAQSGATTRTVTRTVDSDPQLVATPTSPSERPVSPGDRVTLTYTFENLPGAGATASSGTVTIPTVTGLRYVPDSATIDGSTRTGVVNPFADGEVVGALPPGASTTVSARFDVVSPQADGTLLTIPATLVTAEQTVATDEKLRVSSAAQVTVLVRATPDPANLVAPGTIITYVVEVSNATGATDTARDVRVTGDVPDASEAGPDAVVSGTADPAAFPWVDELLAAQVLPGETATATFSARVLPGSSGAVLTQVTSVDWEQDRSGQTAVTNHTRSSAPVLDVSLSAAPTSSTRVAPGQDIDYTATITNTGDAPATDVRVTWPTPDNATAATNPYDPGPFSVGDLAPGATVNLGLTVTVSGPTPPGSEVDTTVSVAASELAAPESDTLSHAIDQPTVVVLTEVVSATTGEVVPGETVTVRASVSNTSTTVDATSVDVTVALPDGLTYLGSPTEDGAAIAPSTPSPFASGYRLSSPLAAGETTVLELQANVDQPQANGTVLEVSAGADAFELAGTVSDVTSVTVRSAPTVTVTTTATPPSGTAVAPMQTIAYAVTVANDAAASDVARSVTFTLPTPSAGDYVEGSASVVLPDGSTVAIADAGPDGNPFAAGYVLPVELAPGESADARFSVTASGSTGTSVDLSGTVAVATPGTGGPATASHPIGGSAASGLVVSELRLDGLAPKDEFIELYNPTSGPIDASGVQIRYSDGSAVDQGVLLTLPLGTSIPANHHYLVVNEDGFTYPDEPAGFGRDERRLFADLTYSQDIDEYGGVQVRDAFGEVLDAVGIRARPPATGGSLYREGAGLPLMPTNTSGSYERRHGGTNGNCVDSDANEDDFRHVMDGALVRYSRLADGPTPCGVAPVPLPASAGSVVISQVRGDGPATDGLGGGTDEFIELFNATGNAVSLSGWTVQTEGSDTFTFSSAAALQPGQYLLLGGARDGRDRYTAPDPADPTQTPDAWYGDDAPDSQVFGTAGNATLKNGGSVQLLNAGGALIDAVSLGAGTGEGRPLPKLEGRTDHSYERLNGGDGGSCVDTGDNLADFHHIFQARPRNLSAARTPCPSSPPPAPVADLSVTLTPAQGAWVPQLSGVSYDVSVVNGTATTATGLSLKYTATGLIGTSAVLNPSTTATGVSMAALSGGYLLPDLAPGASHRLRVTGTVLSGLGLDPVVNETELNADQLRDRMDDLSLQWTSLTAPALDVAISADPPNGGRLFTGQVVTYTLDLSNRGPATANALALDVSFPADMTYEPGTATGIDGAPIAGPSNPFSGYTLPPLAPGGSHQVTFRAIVDAGTADGSVAQVQAELRTSGLPDREVALSRHVVRTPTGSNLVPWAEGAHLLLAALAVAWFELRRSRRELTPVLVALPRRPGTGDRRTTPRD